MPVPGAKNFSMTPAAKDLGLGDMVQMQLDDDLAERKKKLLAAQAGGAGALSGIGSMNMGGAASALFGNAGSAA